MFFLVLLTNSICALRVVVSFSNSWSSQLTRKAVKNFPGVLYKISLQANNQQPYQWDKSCYNPRQCCLFQGYKR